jgi:hypothetical protein
LSGFFTYMKQFGKPQQMPGGVNFRSEGGALTATQGAASTNGRFRVSFNCQIQNITNHGNVGGFIGTLTSPNYGKPSIISGTRKVDFGIGFSF